MEGVPEESRLDEIGWNGGVLSSGRARGRAKVRSTPAWCRFGGCHSHPWLLLPAERLGW